MTLKRVGAGQSPIKSSVECSVVPRGGVGDLFGGSGCDGSALEDLWKAHPTSSSAETGHLTANVRISSLSQWGRLQGAMARVPNVSSVAVQAIDIGEARVSINYLGSIDQLSDALSAQGVSLTTHGGEWSLSASGTP